MKRTIKSKLGKVINFIKIEGKFKPGDIVIVKKTSGDNTNHEINYIGKCGIVSYIDYSDGKFPIVVDFKDGKGFMFAINDIRKATYEEEAKYYYSK